MFINWLWQPLLCSVQTEKSTNVKKLEGSAGSYTYCGEFVDTSQAQCPLVDFESLVIGLAVVDGVHNHEAISTSGILFKKVEISVRGKLGMLTEQYSIAGALTHNSIHKANSTVNANLRAYILNSSRCL